MQLTHEVVRIARDSLGREADGIFERQSKVAAKAVRLEAAGLDHASGLAHNARQREALLPMAVLLLDQLPAVGAEFIKDHHFRVQLLAHPERAFLVHDLARVAHAAAVAHRERPGAHGF